VIDVRGTEHGAHRDDARGEALGRCYQIRRHAEEIRRKRRSETSEPGDDLIEDQENAVVGADLAQPLQVVLRRYQDASRASDRLDDNRGNGRRIVQLDDADQVFGVFCAVFRHAAGECIALRIVGMAHVVNAGQHCSEGSAVGDDAADRDTAKPGAVIAALAADQACTCALSDGALIGQSNLQRRVDAFGPGIGEEDMVKW